MIMTEIQNTRQYNLSEVSELYDSPFNDLLFKAHTIHRENFNPNEIQISTLLSIKTGACPENCKYCPQSAHYNTKLKKEPLLELERIKDAAKAAKESGASRFCMGAAWRNLHDRDVEYMQEIIKEVKKLGLETCMTLGMLTADQAQNLKDAGLDYYNHNLDSSEEFYEEVISTRKYQDRLDTLQHIASANLKTCSGGIVGMGEKKEDRIKMLLTLAALEPTPKSVPINMLEKVAGTPLENAQDLDSFDFIRTIAIARIILPQSYVRLSAGREAMSEEMQALCFFAGANSIFYGEKLLTQKNPSKNKDKDLMLKLGLSAV
jgi:biotin synthase